MPSFPGKPGLFAALLLVTSTGVANADGPDTSTWSCRFCTYASGWYGSLDFGPGYLDEAEIRYTSYHGLDDAGAFPALDGEVHWRGARETWLDIRADDLGTDRRRLQLRGGRRGAYTINVNYAEISRYRGFGASTPYLGVGSNSLGLPANWVAGATTGGLSSLGAALRPVDLSTDRRTLSAGLDLRLSGAWRYEASVRHMDKQGTRPFGAGVFTINTSHLPVPVDFSENAVGMALNYSGQRGTARISLDRSWFNNDVPFVTWQNPFEPIGNTGVLRASLEPDSDAWRLGFAGSFRPRDGMRLSASASIGRHRQDDRLLPYSINPDFDHLALPRASLDGRMDLASVNLAARLSARLSRKLNLRISLKADERDNRTAIDLFTPVITDLVERPATPNRPYSFERRQAKLALDYRLGAGTRLNLGVEHQERERSLQSVRQTDENSLFAEISLHQWSAAQLRLRFEGSDRDTDPYVTVNDPGLQENPLTRKFNLAGRDRRRLALELDFAPGERLHASIGYYRARDRYDASVLGLLESDEDSFSLDLGYAVGGVSLYGFAAVDYFDSGIAGAVSNQAAPWSAHTQDRFLTFGGGASGQFNERLAWSAQFGSSRARGRIETDSGAGEAPFPELRNRLHHARLRLAYRPEGPWGWTLSAEREHYRSSDWQIDGIGPGDLAAVLSLGDQSPNARALLLRMQAHYRY
ncbi:MAG: MtrB/PioB family decaheme-associated outer membrane protein [Xanthomonadales bacterium]|nr:MtrB/PioB family decaheme-associated outer membrane protein [Xanthomonadales bacterium]